MRIPSQDWTTLYYHDDSAKRRYDSAVKNQPDDSLYDSPLTKSPSVSAYPTTALFTSSGAESSILNASMFGSMAAPGMSMVDTLGIVSESGGAGGVSGPGATSSGVGISEPSQSQSDFDAGFKAGDPSFSKGQPGIMGTIDSIATQGLVGIANQGVLGAIAQAGMAHNNPGVVSPPTTRATMGSVLSLGMPGMGISAFGSMALGAIGAAAYGLSALARSLGLDDLADVLAGLAEGMGFGGISGLGQDHSFGLGDFGISLGDFGYSAMGFDVSIGEPDIGNLSDYGFGGDEGSGDSSDAVGEGGGSLGADGGLGGMGN